MFRRQWSGLPKDASFPSDLQRLGYHINENDEVRSNDNPDYYFKFFLDHNQRINQRQRFAFDNALEDIIHKRLEEEGLQKTPLPLGTPSSKKHSPIFVDTDLEKKSRVVVVFGECNKHLGLLAGRVANGRGGVNKGSMVSVVKQLRTQQSTPDDPSPPGIVLANVGQVYWWPEGKRALTVGASKSIPLPSLVHAGREFVSDLNEIPGSETSQDHVRSIFNEVLASMMGKNAVLDIVAVGDTCDTVEKFLDEEKAWNTWGKRLSSMLLVDTICAADSLTNESFKDFLDKRARCYLLSPEAVDLPLAPPTGNPSLMLPALGMPCYSSSEPDYLECILITACKPALAYLERNALAPDAVNDEITVVTSEVADEEGESELADVQDGQFWEKVDDSQKPSLELYDPDKLEKERREIKAWKRFEETGEAPAEVEGVDGQEETPEVQPIDASGKA